MALLAALYRRRSKFRENEIEHLPCRGGDCSATIVDSGTRPAAPLVLVQVQGAVSLGDGLPAEERLPVPVNNKWASRQEFLDWWERDQERER